jgi:hypothetical protein
VFQSLNSFESVDSRKTLPWLGLSEYSPKVSFLEKTLTDEQIRRVLHRPFEPASLIRPVAEKLFGFCLALAFSKLWPEAIQVAKSKPARE